MPTKTPRGQKLPLKEQLANQALDGPHGTESSAGRPTSCHGIQ